jgi:GT2 family glycosyltransferase
LKDITIVVVNYNTDELLEKFLASLKTYEPKASYDLIIVDIDNKTNKKSEALKKSGYNVHSFSSNVGYAKACNYAASISESRIIGFFNADTEFLDNHCIDYCIDYLDNNKNVAVVGPMQLDQYGRCTHCGIYGTFKKLEFPSWLSKDLTKVRENKEATTISGSAYFTKRSVWDEMCSCIKYQEIDPESDGAFLNTPLYYEETWYSYHVKSHGHQIWYLGEATMIHHWNKSMPKDESKHAKMNRSKILFEKAVNYHD